MKAVILAGGEGTRLWPLSTKEKPKQFQKLVCNKTMLELTIDRLDFLKPSDIYIATNKNYLDTVLDQTKNIPKENIIVEPHLRDTSPCIGLAATIIEKKHPDEVMAIIYADHLIKNKKNFQKNLKIAEKIAKENDNLVIVEVPAKEPNPNYGYVKLGSLIKKINNTEIYHLDKFVEKPSENQAKKYIETGNYLWNTGIYVWKASSILKRYKKHQPDTFNKLKEIQKTIGTKDEETSINRIYSEMEKISIDYAIMEKVQSKEVIIVKAFLGWSDIGNFQAVFEELAINSSENITRGNIAQLNCFGCLIYGDQKRKIKAIGLDDIVIVDTKDGLLVCKKNQAKQVKEI